MRKMSDKPNKPTYTNFTSFRILDCLDKKMAASELKR